MNANNLIITGNLLSVSDHSFTLLNQEAGYIEIFTNKESLRKIRSYSNINDHIGVKGHLNAKSGVLQIISDRISFINKQ